MKKASIELSVNFLVVMIISIIMLGIGIFLLNRVVIEGNKMRDRVSEYNKDVLKRALDDNALVSVYPISAQGAPNKPADFDLGIRNELGHDQDFCVGIDSDQYTLGTAENPVGSEDFGRLYNPGPYSIPNTMQAYLPLRLIAPKEVRKGSYLFNICVCAVPTGSACITSSCTCNSDTKYGLTQKVQVNIG